MEFSKTPINVVLLESGTKNFRHRTQHLYRGESVGRPYMPMEFTRRRQFGGTTKTWFGRCRPLDRIDFIKRDWLPYSGWPLTKETLDPYFARAHEYCQLGPYRYEPEYLSKNEDSYRLVDESGLETKAFQFSPPTDFGVTYGKQLEQSDNIRVILNANAVNIFLNNDGNSVSTIDCITMQKKRFRVKSRAYILAAGGIEVTRLMLASRNVHPNGVGNHHDLLGRFFMEHPHIFSLVVDRVPDNFSPKYFKMNYEQSQENIGVAYAISLPEEIMQKERLLNASAFFVQRPMHKADDIYYSRGAASFLKIADMAQHISAPSFKVVKYAYESIQHAPTFLVLLGKTALGKITHSSKFTLRMQIETIPNPDSRITLSDKKDVLGVQQPKLNWQLTQQDLESYHRFESILLQKLLALGFQARKINHELEDDGWPVSMLPGKHHMGTTRMSIDPRKGVVDENGRVHGLSNLYVASSSVFPTSGMANPTLTILALAIRLAKHVEKTLGA